MAANLPAQGASRQVVAGLMALPGQAALAAPASQAVSPCHGPLLVRPNEAPAATAAAAAAAAAASGSSCAGGRASALRRRTGAYVGALEAHALASKLAHGRRWAAGTVTSDSPNLRSKNRPRVAVRRRRWTAPCRLQRHRRARRSLCPARSHAARASTRVSASASGETVTLSEFKFSIPRRRLSPPSRLACPVAASLWSHHRLWRCLARGKSGLSYCYPDSYGGKGGESARRPCGVGSPNGERRGDLAQ